MSENTRMPSMSGRNRHSEENRSQQTYGQRWDRGSDIESSEKDREFTRLKQELDDFKNKLIGENHDLKQQINDMEEVIEGNNREIEEKNGQLAKFNGVLEVCIQKITTFEKENAEQLTKIGELTQELAKEKLTRQHLNSMETTQINTLTESNKKQDLTIKMLNTINNNLIKNINQKKAEMKDMSKDFKHIESDADKYRNKYKDSKSENQRINKELEDINTENQKLKKEIQKLKKSRKYHEDDKNHHKQKVVAVSHTAVKQQELYVNAIQKVFSDNMKDNEQMIKETTEKLVDCMKDFQNKSKRKMAKHLAKTNADIMKERDNIHKKQKKMEQKTDDGKKACPSCDNTYVNMKGLRTHLTVAHNMNTTDISKNKPQIIRFF